MLYNDTQINGITTELQVAQKLVSLGYIVSIPFGNNSRYDLIVDTDNNLYRVQVKYAHLNDNGSYTVPTSNINNWGGKKIRKYYTKEDVDLLMTIIEDQLVVIPVEMINHSVSKIFRTELPKYGTKSTCNLISDFTIEKYLL